MSGTFNPRYLSLGGFKHVCAISEKAINSALESVFAKRPSSAGELLWENEQASDGQLRSTMLAPQIELDMETVNSLNFKLALRFDKGQIYFGQNTYQRVDSWVVIFNLVWPKEATLNGTRDQVAALENTPETVNSTQSSAIGLSPGEYSIHRLLAIIAYLDWGSPVWEESYLTDQDGTKVYLDKWAADSSNNALYSQVQQFIRELGLSNKHASFLMQNMQVDIPRPKVSEDEVNIAPKMLRLQQYPYITPDKWGVEDTGSPMTGQTGNPYNCLCFCEIDFDQGSSLPEDPLPFNGNFAWPGDGSKNESLGTFAIKSSVSPSNTLHYLVQCICQEVIAYPLPPHVIDKRPGENTVYLSQRFAKIDDMTNDEYNDLEQFQSEEGYYDLSKSSDVQYCWSKSVSALGNDIYSSDGAFKANYTLTAETSVHLGIGPPDSPIFTLSGHVEYFGSITWPQEDVDNVAQWYPDFNHEVDWTATFNMDKLDSDDPTAKIGKCILEEVDGEQLLVPSDLDSVVPSDPDSSWDYFLRGYRKMVGGILVQIPDLLRSPDIKVACPGKNELEFGTAALNAVGDIIIPIHYLEPDASRVTWISTPEDHPQNTNTATNVVYTSDTSVTKDTPHITWTGSVTYDADSKHANLTLQGSNKSGAKLAFKSVKATFLRMQAVNDNCIWNADCGSWSQDTTSDSHWSITRDSIPQNLKAKVEIVNNEMQFTISPQGTAGYADPDRFFISSGGSFALNLNGKANTDGNDDTFIVQMTENWAGLTVSKPINGRADAFIAIELKADGSSTTPSIITQSEADTERGVKQT
ncbi:uncharacterized protein EAF02_006442 [Botrytis sinoallii]|uniref:uncharacterized protein n=1 Tax=Botrytis sinoallii TaxID=1463999 RepID=UPI001900E57F|nr:uncharacterized protein EAF02_006442 [Botrytis sinoallii]KAF7881754.1 hypothetical protein EAF02_006442 [Botrytis sinoallii]